MGEKEHWGALKDEYIFENASSPGSYGGVESLYREAKQKKMYVSRQQVEKLLSIELSYTLHKPVR